MNQFTAKFKLIFLPFVIISFCTVSLYTFLNWLLLIKFDVFKIDDDIVNFLVPMALPWIPLLIWIRPRIKLLKLKVSGRKDPVMGFLLLTWVTMALPIINAQMYIATATGQLTQLNRISEINTLPATKYYTVKQYYVSKKFARIKPVFKVSGRYNNEFNMSIYVAIPIFDRIFPDTNRIDTLRNRVNIKALVILNGKLSTMQLLKKIPADSIQMMRIINPSLVMPKYGDAGKYGALVVLTKRYHNPKLKIPMPKIYPAAWITLKFNKTISNSLSGSEKEKNYKGFARDCEQEFDQREFNKFIYLDRLPYGSDLKNYLAAIATKDNDYVKEPIVLSAVNQPFSARNGNELAWIFGSFGIGAAIFLIILQFVKLRPIDQSDREKESSFSWDWAKNLLLPRADYTVTPIIIDINILVFIIMVCAGLGFISFTADDLLKWGGNFRPLIIDGQYWRLITNMFLHGGIMHILFNMYGLIFVGIFLEPVLGKYRYLFVYIFTGVVASLSSMLWHSQTVSVGASGAIFGLYGVFLSLLTTNFFPKGFKKSFLVSTAVFVGYNLLYGLAGDIDNAAHIGGLISGLLLGYMVYPTLQKKNYAEDSDAEV